MYPSSISPSSSYNDDYDACIPSVIISTQGDDTFFLLDWDMADRTLLDSSLGNIANHSDVDINGS